MMNIFYVAELMLLHTEMIFVFSATIHPIWADSNWLLASVNTKEKKVKRH